MALRSLAFFMVLMFVSAACGALGAIVPDSDPLASVDAGSIGDWTPVVEEIHGLKRFSRTEGERFILSTEGGERDFQAGVNLGATVPGHFPGELAVDAETYRRWFGQMARFGFTSIRIYTMLPPHFYQELRDYNLAHPDHPLYLIHGAWPPVGDIREENDLHAPAIVEKYRTELSDLVDAVHGNAVVDEVPGRAHGTYTADVSPWLAAWAIGSEFDGLAVAYHDEVNSGMEPFRGRYFVASSDATPTESWMAMMLDYVAESESQYGSTMPMAFVNWVTTDPLDHPFEPLTLEDYAGIDPMHVTATPAWPGGYFAAYHAYPYYPDVLRFEPGIADYMHHGVMDPYAGLLSKYAEHHAGIPLMILEFGVPTGLAKAHEAPLGRDQGDHSEQRQAEINADLLQVIADLGLAGGYVFSWTDEWFKLTWNTFDFELADRRPMWMNAWTNEAHFGLVAADPGLADTIVLDGDGGEWEDRSRVLAEGRGSIRELRAVHDEGYLYLRIVTDQPESWESRPLMLGFDVIDGEGAGIGGGVFPAADYRIVLDAEGARVEVRSDADPMLNDYAGTGIFSEEESAPGGWNLHRLITNLPYKLRWSGVTTEVEVDPAGLLHHGTTDRNDESFDSRSTWFGKGTLVEMRVPWHAIGFADPSSKTVFDADRSGEIRNFEIDRIGIGIATGNEFLTTDGYIWEPWNQVEYVEHIKAGADVFARTVIALNR